MPQVLRLASARESGPAQGNCAANQDESVSAARGEQSQHLWIAHSQFFTTSLLVLPSQRSEEEVGSELYTATAEFYDPDGYLFNECGLACPGDRALRLPLQSFMESCKLESGWKHAHVCIRSKAPARYVCEFNDKSRTTFYSPTFSGKFTCAHAFPVTITAGRKNLVALVSGQKSEQTVKLRFFIGNRKPECDILIPPMGVHLVSLEDQFPDFCRAAHGGVEEGGSTAQVQAYLRLSTAKAGSLSVFNLQQNTLRGGVQAFSCGASL